MKAETLGYHRFWIAEHHTDDAAQSSPEVLLPLLASKTRKIRIGAGGILLPYYSPLKVAEIFLMLEALFPGRIDLGVCRGPGVTNDQVARALVCNHDDELGKEAFAGKARTLLEILRAAPQAVYGDDALCARPLGVTAPPVWILGASPATMELAACLGTGYGHSLIFGGGLATGPDLMARYHKQFVPNTHCVRSHGAIAVTVVCADTEGHARQVDADLVVQGCLKSNIVGSPKQCVAAISLFAEMFEVEEVIVATFVQNGRARDRLYRWLAEELFA